MTTIFGPGSILPAAVVRDQQTSGTAPPSITSASAWNTVRLSSVAYDPYSMVSLSANQIVLPAGDYLVWWEVPLANTLGSQTRLYNVTDASVLVNGQSALSGDGGGTAPNVCFYSLGIGSFSVGGSKTLELQVWVSRSGGTLGAAVTTGEVEIYSSLYIKRLD